MYRNCCTKCGSIALHTEVKGNNTGLYCDDCGAWIKWLGKDELRAFEHAQKESMSNQNVEDGIYIELFAVKDGVRYNSKVVNIRDVSTLLTNSLMDGIEKLCH